MKVLFSVILAFVGALIFVTTAMVVRGRVRELKEHVAHCKQLCDPGQQATTGAIAGGQRSCHGAET